ncbi:MAG: hypothetical protein ACTSXD_04740 [Candidatus Heimdallarchaeaceae archaeon]
MISVVNLFEEDEEGYREFFDKKLEKYGVSSPDKLEGKAKKKFFDEVDREWKAVKERD